MTVETMIELPSACQNGTVPSTSPTFFQNCPPGSSGGQVAVRTVLSLEPATADHQSG